MAKLALVAAALTLAFAGSASAVTYEPEPEFCQPTVVRDFLAPLERLPELREPRAGGQLGFTKARVTLKPTQQLVVGGGPIGFRIQRPPKLPAIEPGWTVIHELSRIDWRGKEVRTVDRGVREVRSLGDGRGSGLTVEVGARPAPYRLTVELRDRDGRRLGSYGFYFRVAKPFKDSRLALNATSYRPEQTVFGRVENFGTMRTAYGVDYGIERLEGGQWSEAPESPLRGPWITLLAFSPPGKSGRCLPFRIPPEMPPGRYRMTKSVGNVTDASQATFLTAEFDVLP